MSGPCLCMLSRRAYASWVETGCRGRSQETGARTAPMQCLAAVGTWQWPLQAVPTQDVKALAAEQQDA